MSLTCAKCASVTRVMQKHAVDKRNGARRKEILDPVIEKDRKSENTVSLGRNASQMFLLSGYWLCLWDTRKKGNLLGY